MKFTPEIASESQECDTFCEWMNLNWFGEFLISIPNQALCYTNPGVRKKLSRQGVKKGIPDYFLSIPCGKYSGLFLEMKKSDLKGKPNRPEQIEWINKLNKMGYKALFVYGVDEAIKAVTSYILEKKNDDFDFS